MAPFDLSGLAGTIANALVFGAIGFGFGVALELGGFGDTRKLAAQFYLKDMTVLKVMFTAIVVAAVLVAGATGFGLLDMSRVWVNPTYLWPGIVGGLIMGVGFVLGGFCPGTTLVATATLKIDGMIFLLGALIGVWLFGETVGSYETFFISSNMGRFTLPEWLGLPVGVTVLLVVLMALPALLGAASWPSRSSAAAGLGRGLAPAQPARLAGRRRGAAAGERGGDGARASPPRPRSSTCSAAEVRRPVEERGRLRPPGRGGGAQATTSTCRSTSSTCATSTTSTSSTWAARAASIPAALTRPEPAQGRCWRCPASAVTFLVANGEAQALATWKELKASGVRQPLRHRGRRSTAGSSSTRRPPAWPSGAASGRRRRPAGWRFAYATGDSLPVGLAGAGRPRAPSARPAAGGLGGRAAHGGHGASPGRPTSSPGR